MALFKIFKGDSSKLGAEPTQQDIAAGKADTRQAHAGFAYFTIDDGKFYIDIEDNDTAVIGQYSPTGPANRIPLNAVRADDDRYGNHIDTSYATSLVFDENNPYILHLKAKSPSDILSSVDLHDFQDNVILKGTVGNNQGDTVSLANFPPSERYRAGEMYRVTTTGACAGQQVEVGDIFLCIANCAHTSSIDAETGATVTTYTSSNSDWIVLQANIAILPVSKGGTNVSNPTEDRLLYFGQYNNEKTLLTSNHYISNSEMAINDTAMPGNNETLYVNGDTRISGTLKHIGAFESGTNNSDSNPNGNYSQAMGQNTQAHGRSTHVFGEFNITNPISSSNSSTPAVANRGQYVEIVGNGSATNDRSNARTLDWDGNETLSGGLSLYTDLISTFIATVDGNNKMYVRGPIEFSYIPSGSQNSESPTAPTMDTSTNDGHLATTAFVHNLFKANDAMLFKGVLDSSSDIPASGYEAGWTYRIRTAGFYAGKYCESGDLLIAVYDYVTSPNTGNHLLDWQSIQVNVDGAVYMGQQGIASDISTGTQLVNIASTGKVTTSSSTVGTNVKPVYLNQGVITEITNSINATVDSGTANTIAYYSAADKIEDGTITTNGTYLGKVGYLTINGDHQTTYRLKVSGATYITGVTTHGGNVVSDTDNSDDIGTDAVRWKNGYFNAGLHVGAKNTVSTANSSNFVAVSNNSIIINANVDSNQSDTGLCLKRINTSYAKLYIEQGGTASQPGLTRLVLGNSTATGTAGNASGYIELYSANSYKHAIKTAEAAASAHLTHYLPNANGWIATGGTATGTTTGVGSLTQPIYLDATGVLKTTTTAINGGAVNRIAFYSAKDTIGPASTHYIDDDQIAIGSTDNTRLSATVSAATIGATADTTYTYKLYVHGHSRYAGSLMPYDSTSSYSLGAKAFRWKYGYLQNLYISGDLTHPYSGAEGSTQGSYGTTISSYATTIISDTSGHYPTINFRINKSKINQVSIASGSPGRLSISRASGVTATATSPDTLETFTYNNRAISPLLIVNGPLYTSGTVETSSYFLSNRPSSSPTSGGYYIQTENVTSGHLYVGIHGTQAVSGQALLSLGNSRVPGAQNADDSIGNAYGEIQLYNNGTRVIKLRASSSLRNTLLYLPALSAASSNSTYYIGRVAVIDSGTTVAATNIGVYNDTTKQSGEDTVPLFSDIGSASLPTYTKANGIITKCTPGSVFSAMSWTAGTTAGPILNLTVATQARTATIPSASASASGVVTTGDQVFTGQKTFTNPVLKAARYNYIYCKNNSNSTVGYIRYDSGNTTNVTSGRFLFAEYSPNSTASTGTTGNAELYYLPVVTAGLTANQSYTIYTSKPGQVVAVANGGTGKSSWTKNGVIYASASGTLAQVTNNSSTIKYLSQTSNGAPTWSAITTDLGTSSSTGTFYVLGVASGSQGNSISTAQYNTSVKVQSSVLYGAAWNDYAEYRQTTIEIEPGRCVRENGDDTLELTTKRLERGCEIVSDTFGFAIGETEKSKTPIAATGRVLVYLYEGREAAKTHIGWPVCSGPNGTVSIMTEEEEEKYPSRIIGTISAIPDYETWGTGNVKVNGRIWIRIR